MALTVCFQCDKTYGERHDQCPHCGCHNFFSDDDTVCQAVHHLCDDLNAQAEQEKREKLRELWWVRFKMVWSDRLSRLRDNIDNPGLRMMLVYIALLLFLWESRYSQHSLVRSSGQ